MSMTAVPISMRLVLAPQAASSGNGELSWRAEGWARKKAPSAPRSSAATASSIDCSRAADAVPAFAWGRRPLSSSATAARGPNDRRKESRCVSRAYGLELKQDCSIYVGHILKGEKPADRSVARSSRLECAYSDVRSDPCFCALFHLWVR